MDGASNSGLVMPYLGFILSYLKTQVFWQTFSIWCAMPIMFTIEKIWPARQSPWLAKGWLSDIFYSYEPWLHGFFYGAYIHFATQHLCFSPLSELVRCLHPLLQFLLLLLITELIFYIVHRMTHANPILWEFHKIHHSSTQYYSLMTKRFHVVDELLFALPTISAIAFLGADGSVSFTLVVFRRFMDIYGHSNINAPKWLVMFLVTPHFHAWHHSRHTKAIDKNFGRDIVLFDYLFGTAYYPRDAIPTRFGYPEFTTNYFVQQWVPFGQLANRCYRKFTTNKSIRNVG